MPKFIAPYLTKSNMYHPFKPLQPTSQLFHHPWDKFLLSKIVPTNQPPTTNKGKVEITELGIGAATNCKEASSNQTHLDAMLRYGQIIHTNYTTSTGTIRMSSPSWVMPSRLFRTKLSAVPMQ